MCEEIICLGSNCSPGISLRELNNKAATFPFDWVRSTPQIIFDVIKNGSNKYLDFTSTVDEDSVVYDLFKNTHSNISKKYVNAYGQYFTHYTNISQNELINKFLRYFERLYCILNNSKKDVIFIHTNEEYIYHKKSRDNRDKNYKTLIDTSLLLENKYPKLKFKIINLEHKNNNIDINKVINLNVPYDKKYCDFCEFHENGHNNHEIFRNSVTNVLRQYFT